MSFTNYLELKLLDLLFSDAAYTIPATLYVGLSTTAINNDGTGITEPSGNAYARVAVTNNATNWPAATGGNPASKSNGTAVTFPTATGSWGTVVAFFIADASTAGNVLAYGSLTVNQTITTNDTASFAIGNLTITLQ